MRYITTSIFVILVFFAFDGKGQTDDYDSIYLVRNCVILDAKESVQEERDDLIYKWNFGDGSVGVGEVVEHCYSTLGDYEVMLSIIDPDVLTLTNDEWFFGVTISEDYKLSFQLRREINRSISVSSELSYMNKPQEVTFFWDYGDGNYDIGENLTHTYVNEGSYVVRLLAKVSDQDEIINISNTKSIQIN